MPAGNRKFLENTNPFNGVSPGSPSTIMLPDADLIHSMHFEIKSQDVPLTKDQMIEHVDRIELIIAGQVFGVYRIKDILDLNDFYGYNFVDGFLDIFYTQDWRVDQAQAESTALLPRVFTNPSYRIYLKPSIVRPQLKNWYWGEGVGAQGRSNIAANPSNDGRGFTVVKHYDETLDITSDDPQTPTRIRYAGGTSPIRSLTFEGLVDDNIDRIEMFLNGNKYSNFDNRANLHRFYEQHRSLIRPDPNKFIINFEITGNSPNGALNPLFAVGRDTIDFEIYTKNSNNVRMLVEQLARPSTRNQS